ncbi:MAG: alpha/beta fold hydrolase [Pseudonocardiaceae bacterium]|nr:alpha/beta fold hydrolase [Pseudonocardiaceae bacterium]
MLTLALAVLAVVLLLGGAMWGLQRRLIYFPDQRLPPVAEVLPGGREVTLDTADGLALQAWFIPPSGPDRGMGVLVAPGNGGDRADRAPLARRLAAAGFAVLLLDYRGYGGNPGSPDEEGLVRDARAAHRYLTGAAGFPADRLIYFGESLGGAVLTRLATEHPAGGLLLRSPFTDLAAVGRHHYPVLPVRTLLRDRFPVAGPIGGVTVATTVVYGTADSVVPPEQSRDVAAAAGGPVEVTAVTGADHNDRALLDGDMLVTALVELAQRIEPR